MTRKRTTRRNSPIDRIRDLLRLQGERSRLNGLANVDFKARKAVRSWQRLAAPAIAVGLLVGLAITMLRTDIVRMEYDLAETGTEERELLEAQRRLTVEHRNLLDPGRLGRIAAERGFVRPDEVTILERSGLSVAARSIRP